MDKSPFISVVMPVYNCGQYLKEGIESILDQTFQDFEFIIINDGSTDTTLEILNEYEVKDSRIRVINQPNSGIVTALNTGLHEAKGEWIFRMDGDDIALPHRFAVQAETIRRKPHLVLLGGWCQQINSQGIPLKINKYPTHHGALVRNLETLTPFFPHPTACFRRDVVLQLDGYLERFCHAEDTDLWLRLSTVGKIGCCRDVVLKLRKHSMNVSSLVSRLQQLRSFAARICHFRRKYGISDPSKMGEKAWQEFLTWVEKGMYAKAYFQRMQGWQALWNAWYSNIEVNKLKRGGLVLKELMQNPLARKAFGEGFVRDDLARRLAEESKKIWH